MHLVALVCRDPALSEALNAGKRPYHEFHLHPLPEVSDLARVAAALEPLDFAGMLVLPGELQEEAYRLATRSSLDAQEVGAADALTVTPGGLIAEFNLGRAVGAALAHERWHAREASAVILGGGVSARAVSRELSSMGVRHLTVIARHRPNAERVPPKLAASTEVTARAQGDPLSETLIMRADLLVRIDARLHIDPALLGPHLSVVDFSTETLSPLRQQAMNLGAMSIGLREVQAHQLALSLGHILGGRLDVGLFSEALHSL